MIMGDADPDFPDPEVEAREVAEAIGGTAIIVPGVGHYPQSQAPSRVTDAVTELAAGLG